MRNFIRNNKLFSTIIGFLFTSIITYNILWGTWVTNQLFCHNETIKSHVAVQVAEEKAVSQQIKEVKDDVKEIKEEMKRDNDKRAEQRVHDQEKLMKVLIEIKQNTKR